jgi:hypothetical protein
METPRRATVSRCGHERGIERMGTARRRQGKLYSQKYYLVIVPGGLDKIKKLMMNNNPLYRTDAIKIRD